MRYLPGRRVSVGAARLLCLMLATGFGVSPVAAADAVPIAIFDFELLDTSLEGEVSGINDDEQKRLKLISNLLRKMLDESGRYRVVDLAPIAGEIENGGNWQGCNGCDAVLAAKIGATYSVTGEVQKVSNLILNINIYFRDTRTRKVVQVAGVDVRGNTDRSWSRGVSWLVRNRLLRN